VDGEPAHDEPGFPRSCLIGGPSVPDRLRELSAHHRRNESIVVEVGDRRGDDPLPIAEHRRAIADLVDLLEMMRDVEDRDAARLHAAHAFEQPLDRLRLERRRRLVEDEEARADRERAGDLDDLALLDRQLRRGLVDVEVEPPLEQQPPGLPAELAPVDQLRVAEVEEDVLADAERRHDHRALVHARDTLLPRRPVAEAGRRLAVEAHRSTVGPEQPGEDPDERRLPGTVPADERVALAGPHGDGDVLERLRPTEGLPDRLRLRDGFYFAL